MPTPTENLRLHREWEQIERTNARIEREKAATHFGEDRETYLAWARHHDRQADHWHAELQKDGDARNDEISLYLADFTESEAESALNLANTYAAQRNEIFPTNEDLDLAIRITLEG